MGGETTTWTLSDHIAKRTRWTLADHIARRQDIRATLTIGEAVVIAQEPHEPYADGRWQSLHAS